MKKRVLLVLFCLVLATGLLYAGGTQEKVGPAQVEEPAAKQNGESNYPV
jgi:hypothetical protein